MGYDVALVDVLPDHLKCPICLTAFEHAMQTTCGHLFCKPCLDRLTVPECSVCKEPLQATGVFPDRHVQREVMVLKVKCPNAQCEWSGVLKEWLDIHSTTCAFEILNCEHSACGKTFLRKEKRHHDERVCKHRLIPCKRCGKSVASALMKQHNESECTAGSVPCPLQCGRRLIPRSKMDLHMKTCVLASVECPYVRIGCKKRLQRHEVRQHLSAAIGYHTDLMASLARKETIVQAFQSPEIQDALRRTIQNPATVAAAVMQIQAQAPGVQKSDLEHLESRLMSEMLSKMGSRQPDHGETLRALPAAAVAIPAISAGSTDMSVVPASASLVPATSSLAVSDAVEIDRDDPQHLKYVTDMLEEANRRQERMLIELNTNIADLELRVNMCEVASYNGELIWKVTRWSQRRREAQSGRATSIYSQPFYTGYHGYKCCTRLYPNGDGVGRDTHVSLFFVVMQNDYDGIQEWPFRHRVTFSLLSQISGKPDASEQFRPDVSSSSFHRPTSAMNVASGCPKFAELRRIEDRSEGFLTEEDCIYLKVAVEKATIKERPWHDGLSPSSAQEQFSS